MNNGLAVLSNVTNCIATEEANGLFKLELEYPIIQGDKKRQYLVEGNIIKATTPKSYGQLFRITHKKKNLKAYTITANHIFYDLLGHFINDTRPTKQSGTLAIQNILNGTVDKHRFTANSNISRVNSANYVRKNVVETLISDLNQSFLNRWGGELGRDNFNIKINDNIGQDRGYTIKFGKNLEEIEEAIDMSSIITKIMPTGLNANDTTLMLPEKYILSPLINNYANVNTKEFHFTELKVDTEKALTKEKIYVQLRQMAKDLFTVHKIDQPKFNYKVNFVELSQTEEYKNYSVLNQLYLYDIVTIKHQDLGLDLKAKVISYKWDSIQGKYLEIELGDYKEDFTSNFTKISNTLQDVSDLIIQNKTDLEKSIDRATELMNNALGGYVVKRKGEILIMDTEDIYTARKVWKWGINGLGYSSTGYGGRYGLAMTMEGRINADFITTGELNAELIKAGVLMSKNGKTWIDMASGTFNFGNKIKFDGDNLDIKGYTTYDSLALTGQTIINGNNITTGVVRSKNNFVNLNLETGIFKIGNSGNSGNVAEHTNSQSKYIHSDGSFTQIDNQGLYHYNHGTKKGYHYLTFVTSCVTHPSVNGIVYVQLPEVFRGKDWSAYTSIYDTNNSGGDYNAVQKAIAFTAVEDKANNRVGVTGYTNTVNVQDATLRTVGIGARIMVVA